MTNSSPETEAPTTQVQFAQYHQPALTAGDYTMTLTQDVTIRGQDQPVYLFSLDLTVAAELAKGPIPAALQSQFQSHNMSLTSQAQLTVNQAQSSWTIADGNQQYAIRKERQTLNVYQPEYTATRRFTVQGPRYALDPADIQAVFPPDGSLGDHSAALPHVIFNRSSLPWERAADPQDRDLPWLALLLFDDAEKPAPMLCTLADLREASRPAPSSNDPPWWPGLSKETGEDETTKVTVIDVPRSRLAARLPAGIDLAYLAHVRRGTDGAGALAGAEVAVLIGNRLPGQGAAATVHLVSLENRYTRGSFDFKEAADADNVRLISLKSWSFACVDANQSFLQLLWNLDPYTQGQRTKGPATLQLPAIGVEEVDQYLAMGWVPLSHTLREGSRTVSWYHGPLIPWENTGSVDLPSRAADQLTRFYPKQGMFDVSYAAAWELGRLLTLQSKQVATSLYAWKRRHAQQLHQIEQQVLHLPFGPEPQNGMAYLFSLGPDFAGELDNQQVSDQLRAQFQDQQYALGPAPRVQIDQAAGIWTITDGSSSYAIRQEDQALNVYGTASDLEKTVNSWFDNLNWLRGVPFNYLVPDERMLPTESIRFFWLDPVWIDCLLDGAFSIGRVTTADHAQDQAFADRPAQAGYQITGFLLRSDVVSGWPGLRVDGYDTGNNHIDQGRMERLSPNVLICLFRGVVSCVVLSQKPETLHFGLDGAVGAFFKKLRDPAQGYQERESLTIANIPWRAEDPRTLEIAQLATLIKDAVSMTAFTAAHFALQMTEATTGVEYKQ